MILIHTEVTLKILFLSLTTKVVTWETHLLCVHTHIYIHTLLYYID